MSDLWHRSMRRFCHWFYFERVTVIHPERLPKGAPVLFLGLHRNGAVDGFVYDKALRSPTFMISTQLRKSFFARMFFDGITVTRGKDEGDRTQNSEALQQCIETLQRGENLFVFPEGTSSLGPRHLPFKAGGVQILIQALDAGVPAQVVPVGIHYECAWSFRSKVEVVIGEPISTLLPESLSPLGRLKEMKRRVEAGLESVGVNVPSAEYQSTIERLAYVSTLATPRSYFKSVKALETCIPKAILAAWKELEAEFCSRRCLAHQGIPLFPMGSVGSYLAAFVVLAPIVLAAVLLNLPPFLGGWWAGRKFPDDRNVISLWKLLIGGPLFALWAGAVVLAGLLVGKLCLLCSYVLLTWMGLKLYYRVKKLAVAVHNGMRVPQLRAQALAFRETVLQHMPNETA